MPTSVLQSMHHHSHRTHLHHQLSPCLEKREDFPFAFYRALVQPLPQLRAMSIPAALPPAHLQAFAALSCPSSLQKSNLLHYVLPVTHRSPGQGGGALVTIYPLHLAKSAKAFDPRCARGCRMLSLAHYCLCPVASPQERYYVTGLWGVFMS